MKSEDKKLLLQLARESISTHFRKSKPEISLVRHLNKPRGIFVTLTVAGRLRGCVGYPYPEWPLFEAVIKSAQSAAFSDNRFLPLPASELQEIKIEISVLSEPLLIEVDSSSEILDKIEIGRDGLIIRNGLRSGLLLPTVPVRLGWSPLEFLQGMCQKAGLSNDSWRDSETSIYSFQAEAFSENSD